MVWFLNRCVAPFLAGCLAAKATTIGDLGSALVLVGFAGLFLCISFEIPSRIVARMKRAEGALAVPAAEAPQEA